MTHVQFRITLATNLLYAAGMDLEEGNNLHGHHRHPLQPAAQLTECHFPASLGKLQLVG